MTQTVDRLGRWTVLALASGMAATAAVAQGTPQASGAISDAQIESNVLRALAGAPELSTQNIQTTTVYGVVTISGNVHDEKLRTTTENMVARVNGVKKVVDELTLGDTPQGNEPTQQAQGSYPPGGQAQYPAGTPERTPESYSPPPAQYPQNGQGGYGQQAPPPQGNYPAPQQGYQPVYPAQQGYAAAPQGGQAAGLSVLVPQGATLRIRINRGLDSNHTAPGTAFDGTVLSDIAAGGAIAIPRGAAVQGIVVDAKKAGVLKGEGKLAIQLTGLTLGGINYPIQSSVWHLNGPDKGVRTVDSAVGIGALGAVIGAVAGGGRGAAIGAGVGAGAGVAGSAASPGGRVIVPPEAVLTFSLAEPLPVKTVSQAEMQRLAYAAGPPAGQPAMVRRRYYPAPYGYPPPPPPGYPY